MTMREGFLRVNRISVIACERDVPVVIFLANNANRRNVETNVAVIELGTMKKLK